MSFFVMQYVIEQLLKKKILDTPLLCGKKFVKDSRLSLVIVPVLTNSCLIAIR